MLFELSSNGISKVFGRILLTVTGCILILPAIEYFAGDLCISDLSIMIEMVPTGPLESVPLNLLLIAVLLPVCTSVASRLLPRKTDVRINKFFMSM